LSNEDAISIALFISDPLSAKTYFISFMFFILTRYYTGATIFFRILWWI